MSSEPRYRVTRIDGYARPVTGSDGETTEPGATFHVIDSRNGRTVASFASENTASGLPHHVRVNVAKFRAEISAAELEAAAVELLAS